MNSFMHPESISPKSLNFRTSRGALARNRFADQFSVTKIGGLNKTPVCRLKVL